MNYKIYQFVVILAILGLCGIVVNDGGLGRQTMFNTADVLPNSDSLRFTASLVTNAYR